jgi:hypothetical protein
LRKRHLAQRGHLTTAHLVQGLSGLSRRLEPSSSGWTSSSTSSRRAR